MNMARKIKDAQEESVEVSREIRLQLGDEINIESHVYVITEISDSNVYGRMIARFGHFIDNCHIYSLDLRKYSH